MNMNTPDSIPSNNSPLGKIALIDGDIIVYRCAFVAEKTHWIGTLAGQTQPEVVAWGEPKRELERQVEQVFQENKMFNTVQWWSRKEVQPVEFATQAIKTTLEAIREKLEPTELKIYLSGKRNFRDDIAVTKPYKGNRDNTPKPVYWGACREYLSDKWGAVVTNGIEADDAVGIESTKLGDGGIIVSNDKDLDQLPGWHYDWTSNSIYKVSKRASKFNLYRQILSGDATDNVPGLDGVGSVRADSILQGAKNEKDLFTRTWNAYKSGSGRDTHAEAWDYFLEQARLIYILRDSQAGVPIHPNWRFE